MALVEGTGLNLMDIARMSGPDGKVLKVAELLSQTNRILEDIPMVECNNGMLNLAGVRTGIPAGTWRRLYGGVNSEKGKIEQVQDGCGMLESYSQPDKAIIDMAPNKGDALMKESRAFIDGLGKTMAKTLFYGDTGTEPEKFNGLSCRYNTYGTDEDLSSYNVLNAGGSGSDNTSIWVIGWGDTRVHGLYPRGSKAGLSVNDMGEVTVTKSDGTMYQAYRTHYKWDAGLAVLDWRYCVRIANIDVSALASAGETAYAGANIINLLTDACYRLPDDASNVNIYCNRVISAALTKLASNKSNLALNIGEYAGMPIVKFWQYPIKRCDAIMTTESAVAAA